MNPFPGQPNWHNLLLICRRCCHVRPSLLLLPLLFCTALADAAPSTRWRQGWALEASAGTAPATSSSQFASLRLQPRAGGHALIVRNLLAGPVQVRLRGLPAPNDAVVLAANEERNLGWLADDWHGARLLLDAVPGDPRAVPAGTLYQLPFASSRVQVSQAFGGRFSHRDAQNLHAVDFPLAEGTPVLAARAGRVMQVIADSPELGCLIRVLHEDGSMAVYAHLQSGQLQVRAGQRVETGQRLAASGNTGRSSGPHLHFAVQANTGLALEAIPFRMRSERGVLQFPRQTD